MTQCMKLLRRIPPLFPVFISIVFGIVTAESVGVLKSSLPLVSMNGWCGWLIIALLVLYIGSIHSDPSDQSHRFFRWILRFSIGWGIGFGLGISTFHPTYPDHHIIHFSDRGHFNMIGRIVSHPEKMWRRVRFDFEVDRLTSDDGVDTDFTGGNQKDSDGDPVGFYEKSRGNDPFLFNGRRVTGKVRLTIYSPFNEYQKGDILEVRSKIKSFRNFNNPGGFDYVRFMRMKGLLAQISVSEKKVRRFNHREGIVAKAPSNGQRDFRLNKLHEEPDSFFSKLGTLLNGIFDIFQAVEKVESYLLHLRNRFEAHINKEVADRDASAILTALTTGRKAGITDELRQSFSRTGASHILAISGLHLSIITMLFYYLFLFVLSLHTPLLIRGLSRKLALILTLVPLLTYALLSGWSPATQRAMIMIIVFVTAALVNRESDGGNSLSAAGIIILLLEPSAIYSVSFQLSFSAVLFILAGNSIVRQYRTYFQTLSHLETRGGLQGGQDKIFGRKLGDKLRNIGVANNRNRYIYIGTLKITKTIFAFLTTMTWVSICAIFGTQVLVMRYFHIMSFSGVVTNMILIPLVGFLALPLGLIGFLFYPFSPGFSSLCIRPAGWIVTCAVHFIEWIAGLSFTWTETFIPDGIEVACYYGMMGLGFFWLKSAILVEGIVPKNFPVKLSEITERPHLNLLKGRGGLIKVKPFLLLLLATGLLSLFIIGYESWWIYKRFFDSELRVTALNVGQGNAAVIEAPKGKIVLVDGGGFSYFSRFDTGEHIISPFLRQKKIMTLDAVILTHPESDHMNGLVYILNHFNVLRLIKNYDERSTYAYKDLMKAVEEKRIELCHPDTFEPTDLICDLETQVVEYEAPGNDVGKKARVFCMPLGETTLQFYLPDDAYSDVDMTRIARVGMSGARSTERQDDTINRHSHSTTNLKSGKRDGFSMNYNDNSVVTKLVFKKTSILFPGDLMEKGETALSQQFDGVLHADILIAPHHGSATSSTDVFLDQVLPDAVVISCGWNNRFGFPNKSVLENYQKRGINLYRTDLQGAIKLFSNGMQWKVEPTISN